MTKKGPKFRVTEPSGPTNEQPSSRFVSETVGPAIRLRRTSLGRRLVDTAARARLDKASLSRIERNLQTPKPETLEAIARALGLIPIAPPEAPPPTRRRRRRRSRSPA